MTLLKESFAVNLHASQVECGYVTIQNTPIFVYKYYPHQEYHSYQKEEKELVVCFAPLLEERKNSYRFFRELAILLSKNGKCVIRFDYPGYGDSFGDHQDLTMRGLVLMGKELLKLFKNQAKWDKIWLIGLRFGADLAFQVAQEDQETIEAFIGIEPILLGQDYMEELLYRRNVQNALGRSFSHEGDSIQEEGEDFFGYIFSSNFCKELQTWNWFQYQNREKSIYKMLLLHLGSRAVFDRKWQEWNHIHCSDHWIVAAIKYKPFWGFNEYESTTLLQEVIHAYLCEGIVSTKTKIRALGGIMLSDSPNMG